jgi:hypothetical protein
VDCLYSLYDALVSINVPNDKARAVVDAMERDMGTTIATKTDLEMLRIATKTDLQMLRIATKTDLQMLRQELVSSLASRDELAAVRADIGGLRQDFGALRQDNALIRKEMELLASRLVVQLGSMLVVGFGVTIASLKFFLG